MNCINLLVEDDDGDDIGEDAQCGQGAECQALDVHPVELNHRHLDLAVVLARDVFHLAVVVADPHHESGHLRLQQVSDPALRGEKRFFCLLH